MCALRNDHTPTKRSSKISSSNSRGKMSVSHRSMHSDDESDLLDEDDHEMVETDVFEPIEASNGSRKNKTTLKSAQSSAGSDAENDDENYDDVDAMSSGDESDFNPETEAALLKDSERDLIQEFKQMEKRTDHRKDLKQVWNMIASPDFSAVEPNIDFGKDPFLGLSPQDPAHTAMWNEAEGDLAAWRLPAPLSGPAPRSAPEADLDLDAVPSNTSPRLSKKVRFRRLSSVTSDEDPSEAFPDLMDSVTPVARYPPTSLFSATAVEAIDFDSSDESGDEYDYSMGFANTLQTEESFIENSDGESESSDPESDGDTTDEELDGDEEEREEYNRAVQEHIRAARAKLNSNSIVSATPSTPAPAKHMQISRETSTSTETPSAPNGTQPKTRVFQRDPSRAALSLTKDGVKLQSPLNPPEKDRAYWERARRAMGKVTGSPNASVSWKRSESRAAKMPEKPHTCNETLGNTFNGNLPMPEPMIDTALLLNATTVPDVFMGEDAQDISSIAEDESDEDDHQAQQAFNMNELIDFDQCSSSEAEDARPKSAGVFSQTTEDPAPSSPFAFPNSMEDSFMFDPETEPESNTLSHLSYQPNLVSSFRINQDRARAVCAMAINPIRRAETSEHNAIQRNRRGAENLPFSPARRRRISTDLFGAGVSKSPRVHRRSRGTSLSHNALTAAELQKAMANIPPPVTPSRSNSK